MNKAEYRLYFAYVKQFLKLKYFCEMCNISNTRLSHFISYDDNALSLEKLELLRNCIIDCMSINTESTSLKKDVA